MSKTILITGATGQQGSAVLDALSGSAASGTFKLLALTRDAESGTAQRLASMPGVEIIQGDFSDTDAVFEKAGGKGKVWGVFSVQGVRGGSEVVQGKAIIDSALKNDVKKFVYTSVERHGDDSDSNPTDVPHFATKHEIENYLKSKAGSKMSWTILRPVAFMENISNSVFGKVFGAMWYTQLLPPKKLQLVSVKDIGVFSAKAFENPDEYHNRALSLAGDELDFNEANQVFRDVLNRDFPRTYSFLGSAMVWSIKDMKMMFKFFNDPGFGADIPKLRSVHPGLLDLKTWLQERKSVWEQ